jgi:hypothetical protein
VAPGVLEGFRDRRIPLRLYLQRTVQATTFRGLVCDLWPLRDAAGRPVLLPTGAPPASRTSTRPLVLVTPLDFR